MARPAPFGVRTMNRQAMESVVARNLSKTRPAETDERALNQALQRQNEEQRIGNELMKRNMLKLNSLDGHNLYEDDIVAFRNQMSDEMSEIYRLDPQLKDVNNAIAVQDKLMKMDKYAKKTIALGNARDEYLKAYKNPNITVNTKDTDTRMNEIMAASGVDEAYKLLQEYGGGVVVTDNFNPYNIISDIDDKKLSGFYNEFPEYHTDKAGVQWQTTTLDETRLQKHLHDRITNTDIGQKSLKEWQSTFEDRNQATVSNYVDFLMDNIKTEFGSKKTTTRYRQGTLPRATTPKSAPKTKFEKSGIYVDTDTDNEIEITSSFNNSPYPVKSLATIGKTGAGSVAIDIGGIAVTSATDTYGMSDAFKYIENGRFTLSELVELDVIQADIFGELSNEDKTEVAALINNNIVSGGNSYIPPGMDNSEGAIGMLEEGNNLVISPTLAASIKAKFDGYVSITGKGEYAYGKMSGTPRGYKSTVDQVFIDLNDISDTMANEWGVEFPEKKKEVMKKEVTNSKKTIKGF